MSRWSRSTHPHNIHEVPEVCRGPRQKAIEFELHCGGITVLSEVARRGAKKSNIKLWQTMQWKYETEYPEIRVYD